MGAREAALLRDAVVRLQQLHDQAAAGVHRNPSVVVFGNPAYGDRGVRTWPVKEVGVLSRDVHDIRYTHVKDGKPYEHEFTTPTELWIVERKVDGEARTEVLITSRDGLPVVEEF
jgi:hypothetical protein